MENWTDQGIVIAVRPHGENGAVVALLTEGVGRHVGYVRGAQSVKKRGVLQIGNLCTAHWSARVSDSMGNYNLEQDRNLASAIWDEPLKLQAMMAACALCDGLLPEREPHPGLFYGMQALFENLDGENWGAIYVAWEIALLKELGFGLDLARCAGGGDDNDLAYVSPKSGRAVSQIAGDPYKEKLFPLPDFLKPGGQKADSEEVLKGLRITSYFLEHRVFAQHYNGIPSERLILEEKLAAQGRGNDLVDAEEGAPSLSEGIMMSASQEN